MHEAGTPLVAVQDGHVIGTLVSVGSLAELEELYASGIPLYRAVADIPDEIDLTAEHVA